MTNILVVDDEVQLRELIAKVLGANGYEVTTAPRVDQAISAMEQKAFDLILTDINMPGESGISLVKKIRQSQNKTPIVVYSGSVTTEMEKELREMGANEVLRKDVGVQVLAEQIGKIVKAKDRIFKAPFAQSEKTILIIDDDEAIRKLLRDFFKAKNYNIREAENGEKGIEMASQEKPSVVLLDMQMPGMDGLATLKKLMEIHPGLGVLIMTGTHKQEDVVNQALALGAYGYFLKPFDFLYLELVVTSKLVIAESN